MMPGIGLHKLAETIFGLTQKLLYIIFIIKLGQVIHHQQTNFSELVPGPFCFS